MAENLDWPSLGDLVTAWIYRHCRQPDGPRRGQPFKLSDWQFWIALNRWRVKPSAAFTPFDQVDDTHPLMLNTAFTYRRTLIVGPQKLGKGPLTAAFVAAEAAGPTVFAGWAKEGDVYRCSEHGCPCGWVYRYRAGEPMGTQHPSPLIQLTANSEEQTQNMYKPLQAMVLLGPLGKLLKVREGFIRIVRPAINGASVDQLDLDRIDPVSSSAKSRIGNPVSDVEQDEAGLYTTSNSMFKVAEAQARGAAGMGGRTHLWTNAWDPTERSYAQVQYEGASSDLFVFYRNPDLEPSLRHPDGSPFSFQKVKERREILKFVYRGSPWVPLDSVDAEARELEKRDPAQAERFFGNRLVQGAGAWLDEGIWTSAYAGLEDA